MPILVDRGRHGCEILAGPETAGEASIFRPRRTGGEWIEIGLLNNMPDAALEATERQFLELLGAAAGNSWIHLRFFSLPQVPRSERGQTYLDRSYLDIRELWDVELDGLIVTGNEPRAADMKDEPYWPALTQVVDWAERSTISTIWSCLAAHAAVLHLDGIGRTLLDAKCSGVFECEKISAHGLTADLPSRLPIPHSRCNTLREEALAGHGYEVLTRSPEAGVDMFARQQKSLFVFFQGHPEYDPRALLGEYRRDVGRFLRRERDDYPPMPRGYFDDATAEALMAFHQRALAERNEEILADFPIASAEAGLNHGWRAGAIAIYRNWLSYLSAQKTRRLTPAEYIASLRLDRPKAPATA